MERLNTEEKRNPDGTFAVGTAPGPGRPKGQSLKEYWRQRFANMTEEEKLEFSAKVTPELIFRMAEGNPAQDNNHNIEGKIVVEISSELAAKHNVTPSNTESGS